jgi:hypothetical protein
MARLMKSLLILLLLLATSARAQTPAAKANDFLQTLGVATHMVQGADAPSEVRHALSFTGIRNVREDATGNPTTISRITAIHRAIGTMFVPLPINGDVEGSITQYEQYAAARALLAAEGPNEMNNFPVNYNGNITNIHGSFVPGAEFQQDLYNAIKADPHLTGIPVFAPSEAGGSEPDNVGLQFLTIPAGSGTIVAEGTKYGDFMNTHNYLMGNGMKALINNTAWGAEAVCPSEGVWDGPFGEYGPKTWNRHFNGYSCPTMVTLPRVTTETGWITSGTNAITEDQQGKLLVNLYLSAMKRGWAYTFIYYMHDSSQGAWGLYHADWTPKLSARYLHNLTTILSDHSSAFSPGSLNYSIPNEPATVHDFLMEKSSRAFELAIWGDQISGSKSVTVSLGGSFKTVKIYDPTLRTSPILTLSNASSVPIRLSDHALIVEVPPQHLRQ